MTMNTVYEVKISTYEMEALLPLIPEGMHYSLDSEGIKYVFSTTKDNLEDLLDMLYGISPRVITFDELCLRNKIEKILN